MYDSFKILWPSVLTALVTGFIGLLASERAFKRIWRLFVPSGLLATLLIAVAATVISCAVLAAIILGPLAAFGTWPPPRSAHIYVLALLAGAALARVAFGWPQKNGV